MSKQIQNIASFSSLLFQTMRICVTLRQVFFFNLTQNLVYATWQRSTFKANIYRAAAFSQVLKNSLKALCTGQGVTKKSV